MANTETITILKVNGEQAITTLRQLRDEIAKDKDALVALGAVEAGDNEKKEQMATITAKLAEEIKLLNQVTNAGKTIDVEAAKAVDVQTASYYELQQSLTALKKAWKDMNAEQRTATEGSEVLSKVKQLDAELKGLDAQIGQYQRNVGNYGQSFKESLEEAQKGAMGIMQGMQAVSGVMALAGGETTGLTKAILALHSVVLVFQSAKGMGGMITQMKNYVSSLFATTAATNTATTATKGFRTALISTGIGAIVVALGALIANLDKVSELFNGMSKEAKKAFEEMKKGLEATKQLYEDRLAIMRASGVEAEVITKKEIQALRELEFQAWKVYEASGHAKKEHEEWVEKYDALTDAINKAGTTILGFLDNADMKRAQKGMTEYEKSVDSINRRFDAMQMTVSEVGDVLRRVLGSDTAIEDTLVRLAQARQEALDELAEKEKSRLAERYKTEKAAADKIRQLAEDSLKSEEQRLTEKYKAELAELEKYHIDTTALTKKYNADMAALAQKRADAEVQEAQRAKAAIEQALEETQKAAKDAAEARLTELEKAADYRIAISNATIDNEELAAQKAYEIEVASYSERIAALQAFAEQSAALGDQTTALQYQQEAADLSVQIEVRALEEKQRIRKRDKEQQQAAGKALISSSSSIFGALADIYESNGEDDKKAKRRAKNMRIASATIDMLSGAVTAYSVAQELGPILGPIMGVINAAAVVTAGTANIRKIKSQDVSGTDSSSAATTVGASVSAPAIEPMVQEVRNVTSASEEQRLNQMAAPNKVYILSSDIEASLEQTKVQVVESSW